MTRSLSSSILFYDGNCALCSSAVQFILKHEGKRTLKFASLESEIARRVFSSRPDLLSANTMIWAQLDANHNIEEFEIRSAAGLRVAGYMGGGWSLLVALWIIPRPLRDWVYNVIARHRHKLFRSDSCLQVPSEYGHRFLDS